MSNFDAMTSPEKAKVCERVYRALQAIGPASATAVSHRSALEVSTVIGALRAMEERKSVRSTYDRNGSAPELWSAVPRPAARR